MTPLSLFGMPFSEIAALLAIVTILGGALAWLIKKHHMDIFLTKAAYDAQRAEDVKAAKEQKDLVDEDTHQHREKILAQVTELNTNMGEFMVKIAEWKSDFHTRVALLEDRQKRPVRRGGGR